MNVLTAMLIAIVVGYIIGLMQGGIHIYTGVKPSAPKPNESPVYNEDLSDLLPPEVREYYLKNNGQMK